MMKNVIALLLAMTLLGCTSRSWVTASDNEKYAFYQNGELVCESTNSCSIRGSSGKEMLLEARKDDIVYGHLLVARQDSKHGSATYGTLKSIGGTFNFWEKMCNSMHTQGDILLCAIVGGGIIVAAPIAILVSLAIPDNIGRLPQNMTIPVGPDKDSVTAFPWDQPANTY